MQATNIGQALKNLQVPLNCLVNTVWDNRLALDYLFKEQVGACTVTGTSFSTCVYIKGMLRWIFNNFKNKLDSFTSLTIWETIKLAITNIICFSMPLQAPGGYPALLSFNLMGRFVYSGFPHFHVRLMLVWECQLICPSLRKDKDKQDFLIKKKLLYLVERQSHREW